MRPRQPLLRLLAVNLAAGIGAAVLMLGGLLELNPGASGDVRQRGDGHRGDGVRTGAGGRAKE